MKNLQLVRPKAIGHSTILLFCFLPSGYVGGVKGVGRENELNGQRSNAQIFREAFQVRVSQKLATVVSPPPAPTRGDKFLHGTWYR